jgi:hypothetical protein
MAHYINNCPLIFDRFKELLVVLFEMELAPSMKRLVTAGHIVDCIFDHENYSFAEIISTSREGITNRQRKDCTEERDKSHLNKARDRYICGITNPLILEHVFDGGDGAPSDPTTHGGKIFTNMYGVTWSFFKDISHKFESWCTDHSHHFHGKHTYPFNLRLMASFR